MKKVTVLGSINLDNILSIDRLPQPGETIAINKFATAAGGKGENQAIALSRSNCQVSFLGAVGKDQVGKYLLEQLNSNKIDTSAVEELENVGTGQAYILLQKGGQNSILINHGANFVPNSSYIKANANVIKQSKYLVAQFEVPLDSINKAFKIAKENGVKTVLNPAPAIDNLPEELLKNTDIITPNETESATISHIKITDKSSLIKSAEYYHEKLEIKNVVITLGSHGSFISNGFVQKIIPALHVKTVDTTGAGDTYIGALVSRLKTDFSNLEEAAIYATRASSLAVQKKGAVPSIPSVEMIKTAYEG